MGKPIPTKATRKSIVAAPVALIIDEPIEIPHVDTQRVKRAIARDIAIVLALRTSLHEAMHVHDPIDPHEADGIFAFAIKGLTDQMLLPILSSGQDVLEGADLTFQRDTEPIAPSNDRHASKLIRKRLNRTKQSYAAAVKTSIYGSYAASRASSRTESRFDGSRCGGSRASASVRLASKVHKMSLLFSLNRDDESLMNSSWIGSQQGSTGTSNNSLLLQGSISTRRSPSPPPSVTGTARVAVDFVELQRRADIARDLSTRESVRRSKDEIRRKSDLRLKLRSLADPTVSLEKEEAMTAALRAKGQSSRLQQSRQGNRGKTPGFSQTTALSPLNGKNVGMKGLKTSVIATNETTTFRTEDYEGLTSDVVFFAKDGELLVGENCFVVEHKLRQELLLDLHTRGVIQPRIQLVATPAPKEEITSGRNSPIDAQEQPSTPMKPCSRGLVPTSSDFRDQIGSFESSPSLELDFQAATLAKGVVLKLPDAPLSRTQASKKAVPRKAPKKAHIPESVLNAKLEKQLDELMRTPDVSKTVLPASQSDSILQTQKRLPTTVSSPHSVFQCSKTAQTEPSAGSPVLPKHFHNGEKHLQGLRIRTPAYPNRLSRNARSRSSMFINDDDGYSSKVQGVDSLFSLHEQ